MSRVRAVFAVTLWFATLATLIALGAWQWQRLEWKTALNETMLSRAAQAPVALSASELAKARPEDLSYKAVKIEGLLEPQSSVIIYRHISDAQDPLKGPGGDLYVPMLLKDGQTRLWVNLGFVPAAKQSEVRLGIAKNRMSENISSLIIEGVLRLPEAGNVFTPQDDFTNKVGYLRDPVRMATLAGLKGQSPFIHATFEPNKPIINAPLPRHNVLKIEPLPNKHLGYAFTWWGLAGVLIIITMLRLRQSKNGHI
jgi:surfeit locus 1 family protein